VIPWLLAAFGPEWCDVNDCPSLDLGDPTLWIVVGLVVLAWWYGQRSNRPKREPPTSPSRSPVTAEPGPPREPIAPAPRALSPPAQLAGAILPALSAFLLRDDDGKYVVDEAGIPLLVAPCKVHGIRDRCFLRGCMVRADYHRWLAARSEGDPLERAGGAPIPAKDAGSRPAGS
jgi:hypothetical protein